MKKKYKSIFFDLDNTLWDFDKNSLEALKLTYIKYDLNTIANDFKTFHNTYNQFNDNCWKEYREQNITKKELISKRFQDTFDVSSITGIDPVQFNNEYLKTMADQLILVDGAIDILDYLTSKKYQLYIITNGFKEVQYKKLANTKLIKYFPKIFISEEVKAPKPSRMIFEHALKSTNSAKKNSIMIGDSWESDILGAMNFGIDQIHYSPNNRNVSTLDENEQLRNSKIQTLRINKLQQIADIL